MLYFLCKCTRWSHLSSAIWPGLRYSMVFMIILMQWCYLATVWAGASINGKRLWYPLTYGTLRVLLKWYLDHDGMIDSFWWVSSTTSNHPFSSMRAHLKSYVDPSTMKRLLTMINLWNNAVRRWYWRKIIAIFLVDGMDCQIIASNTSLEELHALTRVARIFVWSRTPYSISVK